MCYQTNVRNMQGRRPVVLSITLCAALVCWSQQAGADPPAGYYDTFGPELSFGQTLQDKLSVNIAIAKFTHSGSQIIDWTPEGSRAESRNIYPAFLEFVRESIKGLLDRSHKVELVGIFYHVGENDMSFGPYRRNACQRTYHSGQLWEKPEELLGQVAS